MSKTKKKYLLSLVIILGLLIITAVPLILQSNQTAFPLQPTTLANIETNPIESKQNPQPVNLWWNYSWNYRIQLNVREPGYVNRINQTAIVHLTFTSGHCANNSIRVLYYSQSRARWVEVPIQLENLTYYSPPNDNYIQNCDLIFLCNVTRYGTSTYYMYYNDTHTGSPPTYATPLSINIVGASYFTFDTGVISGNYTIRYSGTLTDSMYFDDDACFRVFKVNGTNIIPTSGQHSGMDRIEGDDPVRVSGNVLNWTAELVENGPLRVIVNVSKSSTDVFASSIGGGSYGPTNKIYAFYAYQGYISVFVNSTAFNLPVYDFAAVDVTNQWQLYIDNYNQGAAANYPWTDTLSSPQPYNYMSLVRNDGIGLGLIGYPKWPHDSFSVGNRTSMEFGYGVIDPSVSSFLFRNDGRDPNEYNISIPFRYNIIGLTQGFSQVTDTWYRLNQPLQITPYGEKPVFYPLVLNVTDNFSKAIPGASVTIYNNQSLSSSNTSGTTNSQGLYTFLLNKNYTTDQYWIQAYVNKPYKNFPSDAYYWNPLLNFTYPSSTLNIRMNITSVYIEVWDNNSHRVQDANVTLNYTNGLGNISQYVDKFYASCTFYAWANQNITIEIWIQSSQEPSITVYKNGTTEVVSQPINLNESKSFRVQLNRDILKASTALTYENGLIRVYWSDNVSFYVWFNVTGGGSIDNATWVDYTIYNSSDYPLYNGSMTLVSENPLGNYYANFNTSLVGLNGGEDYKITVIAEPSDPNQLYPTPIDILLELQELPVDINYPSYIEQDWSSFTVIPLLVNLFDSHNNQPVNEATVNYSITGTDYVNQNMLPFVEAGYYYIPLSVFNSIGSGQYQILVTAFKGNYSIPSFNPITLNITTVPTALKVSPPAPIQGFYNQNITIHANFTSQTSGLPITNAIVSWNIKDTAATGQMIDVNGTGIYTGQIPANTVPSSVYILTVTAGKSNYTTQFETVSLEILGAQTVLGSAILIPQLFGSSEFLFAGPLVQVENSWIVAPFSFTYLDSAGNPVPNVSITVTPGLPVFDITSGTIKGLCRSQVGTLQLGAGTYLVLIPTFGLPPGTYMISILARATNYQTQQIPIVLSIKEKAIALGPGVRVPLSVLFTTLAALAIPTALFLSYTLVKRTKIPYIIKRIEEIIQAISRGEKVTIKLIPREKVITDLLSEELAIIGVEPKVARYKPVKLVDIIVQLLVESGMQEKEAYAMARELKTVATWERERKKLLKSVGVPKETSVKIVQTIEEYEEKQAPLAKSKKKRTYKRPRKEEKPEERD